MQDNATANIVSNLCYLAENYILGTMKLAYWKINSAMCSAENEWQVNGPGTKIPRADCFAGLEHGMLVKDTRCSHWLRINRVYKYILLVKQYYIEFHL